MGLNSALQTTGRQAALFQSNLTPKYVVVEHMDALSSCCPSPDSRTVAVLVLRNRQLHRFPSSHACLCLPAISWPCPPLALDLRMQVSTTSRASDVDAPKHETANLWDIPRAELQISAVARALGLRILGLRPLWTPWNQEPVPTAKLARRRVQAGGCGRDACPWLSLKGGHLQNLRCSWQRLCDTTAWMDAWMDGWMDGWMDI